MNAIGAIPAWAVAFGRDGSTPLALSGEADGGRGVRPAQQEGAGPDRACVT